VEAPASWLVPPPRPGAPNERPLRAQLHRYQDCNLWKDLASDSCCRCGAAFKLAPWREDLPFPCRFCPRCRRSPALPQAFDAKQRRPSGTTAAPRTRTFRDWPRRVSCLLRRPFDRSAGAGPGDGQRLQLEAGPRHRDVATEFGGWLEQIARQLHALARNGEYYRIDARAARRS